MEKTFGDEINELARAGHASFLPILADMGKNIAQDCLTNLEEIARNSGLTEVTLVIEREGLYGHRHTLQGEILKNLPVDVDCKLVTEWELTQTFVFRILVVQMFHGGQVHYDFPVFTLHGDNLVHLREISYDPDTIQAFEILLRIYRYEGNFTKEHVDYGLSKPQEFRQAYEKDDRVNIDSLNATFFSNLQPKT